MADLKISQLPAGSVPAGTNVFPVVQSGTTNQVTIAQLFTSPSLVTPALGTPASGTLSSCTGYPTANLTGAGTGVLAALAVNVGTAGSPVVNGGALGTPSTGTLSGCSAYPTANLTGAGTGVLAALAINVGTAGGPVVNGGALGTPTSGNFSTGTFTWPTFNQSTSGTAAGLSATLAVASGGTNNTAFTAKSGNVAGLVFFDGTKLANDTTVTDVGYDTSTHTVKANKLSVANVLTAGTVAFASLGTITPAVGMVIQVSGCKTGLAWGATIVNNGADAATYLAWYNGTNWTVLGA